MNKFWNKYPDIKSELEKINEVIESYNKTGSKELNVSFDHLLSTRGKLLRPAFVIIGSMFSDHNEQDKINHIAAAIETLHMASLIHDDIIDDSELRRGKLSIQAKYSKPYAVFMGDYLLTQVFSMLAEYDYTKDNLKDISRAVSKMCLAEMLQHKLRYKTDVTVRDYLKVVTGKTAGLFTVSLGIGAHISGCDEKTAKELARIGYNIGMAFQLKDDLLDYQATTKEMGKSTLADLAYGYYTLPVIKALREDKNHELRKLLEGQKNKKALKWIKSTDAIKKTERLAERYSKRAMDKIERLPESKGKSILLDLVPVLLDRGY